MKLLNDGVLGNFNLACAFIAESNLETLGGEYAENAPKEVAVPAKPDLVVKTCLAGVLVAPVIPAQKFLAGFVNLDKVLNALVSPRAAGPTKACLVNSFSFFRFIKD